MTSELNQLFGEINAFKKQPLHAWHPEKSVDLDIAIDAAGQWHYQGSPIMRHAIVKLFSTVIRIEGDDYFLVTPPVKYRIRVEDAPFLAVELQVQQQGGQQTLLFRTNMDEVVRADDEHAITLKFDERSRQFLPYVAIRDRLLAKMTRAVFYQLAELVEQQSADEGVQYHVMSAGIAFPLGGV